VRSLCVMRWTLSLVLILASSCVTLPSAVVQHESTKELPAPTGTPSTTIPRIPAYSAMAEQSCGADTLVPASAACASRIHADLDGDGRPDEIVLWGTRTPDKQFFEAVWMAEIGLSSGTRYRSIVEAPFKPSFPLTLVAAADVDGDGRDEVFVGLDHGASTATWLLLIWNGQDLVPAWRGGTLALFHVSGTVTHGSGFECRRERDGDSILTVLAIGNPTSVDRIFTWTEEDLTLRGKVLTLLASRTGTARQAEVEDPAGRFFWFWGAHCDPTLAVR
jgi:hypothetical protein